MHSIRVRFAPSPTGALHIGGARTALFNWLFARSLGGSLVLRLEDTDINRSTGEAARGIIEGLQWLGIDWDEGPDIDGATGPYRQSERLSIYQDYANILLQSGKAYHCFCTLDDLSQERDRTYEQKQNYRHHCPYRDLNPDQISSRLQAGESSVIRIRMPDSGSTIINDLVRGEVTFDNSLLDDIIIQKSDGWPTYNFAVAVDDHSMQISHVIRAEEHLSNTPKQLHIYEALGWDPPQFAHVSMILAPDRSKLSKRHGATSVQEFRDLGYLPEALVNYLALLGWSAGEDADLMNKNELVQRFRLEDVTRSAAVYDLDKLTWMNGCYISQAKPENLLKLLYGKALALGWWTVERDSYALQVVSLIQPRLKTVNQFFEQADYFFNEPGEYDQKGIQKYWFRNDALEILNHVTAIIDQTSFEAESLEQSFRQCADDLSLKAGDLIHPTRLALTGRTTSPGLFETMVVLGKEKCRQRLEASIRLVEALNA